MKTPRFGRRALSASAFFALAMLLLASLCPSVARAQAATGTITGRVSNQGTGQYLRNASIAVVGSDLTTISGDGGTYTLNGVPAGEVRLSVSYAGLDPVDVTVSVFAGQTLTRDFDLTSKDYLDRNVIKLGEFVVSTEREGNAKAINEQRQSLDMKTVIASDAFGDVSEGNVGEFLKLMPGIVADYVEADVRTISIGGMDPKYTTVLMDGQPVSSAASSNIDTGRTFEFEQLSVSSIETVELSKTPTPDVAGSALAGVVNLRTKGAFDRKGRQFSYTTSISANSFDLTLSKTPGWDNNERYKLQPNVRVEYSDVLFEGRLGVLAGYSYSYTFSEQKAQSVSWSWDNNPLNNETEIPRISTFTFRDSPKPTLRKNYNIRLDYKFSPEMWAWVRMDYNTYQAKFFSRDININLTRGTSGSGSSQVWFNDIINSPDPDGSGPYPAGPVEAGVEFSLSSQTGGMNVMGVNSTGVQSSSGGVTTSLNQGGGATNKHGFTATPAIGFSFKRGAFSVDMQAQYSLSTNWYSDLTDGFFWSTGTSNLSGIKLRFNRNGPGDNSLFITQLAGPDWRSLSSYSNGFSASHYDRAGVDRNYSGKADFRYAITGRLPVQLKWGINIQERSRDQVYRANNNSYTHVGADHYPGTADDAPALYAEPLYRMSFETGGNIDGIANMDRFAMGQELKEHPDYWLAPTGNSLLQTQLQNTRHVREQISAAYVQPIIRVTKKLDIAPGLRFERTRGWGQGPGNLGDALTKEILTGSRTGTVDTSGVPYITTRYALRSSFIAPYDTWLRYLHTNYKFRRNLVARLSFNESISRPDYNRMISGVTINNDIAIPPTATLNNPDLKPERARNWNLNVEYYPREMDFVSVSFTRRDIKDLIRSQSFDIPIDGTFLDDPAWAGWRLSSYDNVAKAHTSSLELSYSSRLTYLPGALRGLSVMVNYTKMFFDNYENFRRPTMNASAGVNYRWRNFSASWSTTWSPAYRNQAYNSSNVASFNGERLLHDIGANYQINRSMTIMLTGRNVFNSSTGETFSNYPSMVQRWVFTGSVWQLGLKGTF
jgi:TonB-dependent receptor